MDSHTCCAQPAAEENARVRTEFRLGRLQKVPENCIDSGGLHTAATEAKAGRRDVLRRALVSAGAGVGAAALAQSNAAPLADGDTNILNLSVHITALGQPVATDGYGKPSKFEANVQRRPSPGLTQTAQSPVSFAPLQSLFGSVTPSGPHFERHHPGWWDADPSGHRLMCQQLGRQPARDCPTVDTGRAGAPAPCVALPLHQVRRQPRHGMGQRGCAHAAVQPGMLSCSEFTGVPLRRLLAQCGVDHISARYVLAEGADGA